MQNRDLFPETGAEPPLGLADEGQHLLELYTNPDWNGWAQTVSLGGTATWESWDADVTGESMSHPWGAVGLLGIQKYILGIQPLKPQHEKIQIKPLEFNKKLKSAKGTLPTDRGNVTVEWARYDNIFSIILTLPDNMTAKVYVPKSGTKGAELKVDDLKVTGTEEGNYVFVDNIDSGIHTFVRNAK